MSEYRDNITVKLYVAASEENTNKNELFTSFIRKLTITLSINYLEDPVTARFILEL